jgi:hypothetical protein
MPANSREKIWEGNARNTKVMRLQKKQSAQMMSVHTLRGANCYWYMTVAHSQKSVCKNDMKWCQATLYMQSHQAKFTRALSQSDPSFRDMIGQAVFSS